MVAALERAGAAAVTIHGRSSEQRYTKSADWGLIERSAEDYSVPVIGNGDILTHYEVSKEWASRATIFCTDLKPFSPWSRICPTPVHLVSWVWIPLRWYPKVTFEDPLVL